MMTLLTQMDQNYCPLVLGDSSAIGQEQFENCMQCRLQQRNVNYLDEGNLFSFFPISLILTFVPSFCSLCISSHFKYNNLSLLQPVAYVALGADQSSAGYNT